MAPVAIASLFALSLLMFGVIAVVRPATAIRVLDKLFIWAGSRHPIYDVDRTSTSTKLSWQVVGVCCILAAILVIADLGNRFMDPGRRGGVPADVVCNQGDHTLGIFTRLIVLVLTLPLILVPHSVVKWMEHHNDLTPGFFPPVMPLVIRAVGVVFWYNLILSFLQQ